GAPSVCRSRTFTAAGKTFHYFLGAQDATEVERVPPPESGGGDLVGAPLSASTGVNDLCDRTTANLAGKIVIAQRGNCLFYTKAINAAAAGAVGIIVYNNFSNGIIPAGVAPPNLQTDPSVTIPLASISLLDGNFLLTALQNELVHVTWQPFMAP